MNKLLTAIGLLLSSFTFAQEEVDLTLIHDDVIRTYKLYIPASYSAETAAPLVFNFHGYGSNAFEQMWYGDFRSIADSAGFLVVHPQGTELDGVSHWNVGGWTLESNADDVGFTAAMIDTLSLDYNIDPDRVYATGMSNGGYMSFLLACQLSDRIAAIASVTGSMTPETLADCSPSHPTPVMQIHGTADGTVPYAGDFWTESIDDVLDYWVSYNNCDINPMITAVPDTDTSDGCTAEHHVYPYGDSGTVIEHYKVIDGQHTWPGTFFTSAGTNGDFNASVEIWRFFSQYDLNGAINPTSKTELSKPGAITCYPNPASDVLYINAPRSANSTFEIYSIDGQLLQSGQFSAGDPSLSLSSLSSGIYFLRIDSETLKFQKR